MPAAAQDLLFERVHALSAPGSRIAVEAPGPGFNDPEMQARQRAQMERIRGIAARLGKERDIPDVQDLWYFEDRTEWPIGCATTAGMSRWCRPRN